ncbi:pyridoxal phosphate-dependent decarboxylase family protein [Rubrivirga marina]|uniref:Aspartate aminotransferase family protein n=1 Tax=Rubrivirga marina TaxID=1196024 RepID=A0A271J081_9BACT|nr:aminotransferase class V-fold PLP-dependent enzyme [Rubrivirga marina]PAP76902.1 aspartate aminotransferase family protein [Rubrivirga marina]
MHPDPLDLIRQGYAALDAWEAGFGAVEAHPSLGVDADRLGAAVEEYLGRLTAPPRGETPGMYPFGHPRYAGQMLKPPHPVALAAYAIAARINPNNHALDGGPPTSEMEKEVVAGLAAMFGFASPLGHLTGGGTVANLEALFIAREETGGKAVAVSREGHFTHARMAGVLDVDCAVVASDDAGRMDLDALEDVLRRGDVGTVVLTAATTGLGAVDPIAEAIPLCRRYGARVHVDAAYGGFFRLLADAADAPVGFPAEHFRAIAEADSVVVDPHKHGLQPYGCGAVLFADPAVGRHYRHDSPYTYFTSTDLHLGEISLECSRPGAAAGALWLTLKALPLASDDGLGPILAAGLRAARAFYGEVRASEHLAPILAPETDIVVYAPEADTLDRLDARSAAVFQQAMDDPDDPVFVGLYRLGADRLRRRFPALGGDAPAARVLRSVLMKPEHEAWATRLVARLDGLAGPLGG